MAPSPGMSLVGKVLDGRYEVLEVIGEGGVGVVYRARLQNLDRMVAVKVLHESLVEDAGFVGRFRREVVAMSRLYHPHCVGVLDSGVHESRPYMVLDFLPGQTIKKLLEAGPFDPPRAVSIALQLLETLEYFHTHHVIHRDLKSENVMLVESGGMADFVKVLDFGMAKILTGPGADSQISKMGLVPGTPSAMAPEQIYQLPPDPRIDIYATGILLYEMIVGKRPFTAPEMARVVKMQLAEAPKPPREILGQEALSAELEEVIIKALEKDRIDRFGTAAEMAAALRLTPEGRASATPPAVELPPTIVPPPPRRSGLRLALLFAIFAGAAAVAAVQLLPAGVLPWKLPWTQAATRPIAAPKPEVPVAVAVAAPAPEPAPPPVPVPAEETWLAHRNLAVSYASRGQQDEAFRAIEASVADGAAAARADAVLARAAVSALVADRVAFVIETFRDNPELVEALVEATAKGETAELRHAAHDGLRGLGQEARADLVAMWMLDVEQAPSCSSMRAAFKKLRASKDPRLSAFKAELRARGRKDDHVRCLKRALRR